MELGCKRTIRNSKGKVRQVPVPEQRKALRERPNLRIVTQELWDLAHHRLGQLHQQYGMQPGQKRRGPRVHHSVEYPQGLLRGLVVCGACGRRMWQLGKGGKYFLACPDQGEGAHLCPMRACVPVAEAEEIILGRLADLLDQWPDWLSRAVATMRTILEQQFKEVPDQLAADKRRLLEVQKTVQVILKRLEDPELSQSDALNQHLTAREAEAAELKRTIEAAEQAVAGSAELPDEGWIRQQFQNLPALFREDRARSGRLLRRLIGRIEASAVVAPGKKRGYARLTFRIDAWGIVFAALDQKIPESVKKLMPRSTESQDSPAFVIDLGRPTRMEEWAPKIAEMRERGVPWLEITNITGLKLSPAYTTWKRYVDAIKPQNDEKGGPDQLAG